MAALQMQAAVAQTQLDGMRSDLASRMADFGRLTAQIELTRGLIGETATQVAELDATIATDQQALDARAVHLYRSRELDAVDVLLGTTSLQDFVARADFLLLVSGRDAQLLADVRSGRDRLASLESALEQRSTQLAALRAQAGSDRARIQSAVTSQQAYVDSLNAEVARLIVQQERSRRGVYAASTASSAATGDIRSGGGAWMAAASLAPGAWATVDGRPGADYLVPAGQATRYVSTGVSFDWLSSTYGNADNSPPNSTASASSRPFEEYELTCANKELPFGTLLAVSYGGCRVIVVVTDRGPYITGRSLDLSTAAARALGFDGVVPVHAEVVVPAP
ncbi:MAG TPA: RlpA-like double-psi beta-barrel domain-containing protein [Coriobacteriia bacterium]